MQAALNEAGIINCQAPALSLQAKDKTLVRLGPGHEGQDCQHHGNWARASSCQLCPLCLPVL